MPVAESAPNEDKDDDGVVDINALHAGSIRAMSAFVREPSAPLAETVVRLLEALSRHPQRFVAPCGYDVYREARGLWQDIVCRCGGLALGGDPDVLH